MIGRCEGAVWSYKDIVSKDHTAAVLDLTVSIDKDIFANFRSVSIIYPQRSTSNGAVTKFSKYLMKERELCLDIRRLNLVEFETQIITSCNFAQQFSVVIRIEQIPGFHFFFFGHCVAPPRFLEKFRFIDLFTRFYHGYTPYTSTATAMRCAMTVNCFADHALAGSSFFILYCLNKPLVPGRGDLFPEDGISDNSEFEC